MYDFSDMDDPMAAPKVSMGEIETKVEGDCDHLFRVPGDMCLNCGQWDTDATGMRARIKELEAQLAEAKAQWASPVYARLEKAEARAEAAETARDNCSKTAIELLGSSFCDTHGEKVKQLNFSAFSEWIKEMGCLPCAIARLATALAKNERAEKGEADAGRLRNLLNNALPLVEAHCELHGDSGPIGELRAVLRKEEEALSPAAEPEEGTFTDGHCFTITPGDEIQVEYVRKDSRIGFVWGEDSSWFVAMTNGYSASGYLDGRLNMGELREALKTFTAEQPAPRDVSGEEVKG